MKYFPITWNNFYKTKKHSYAIAYFKANNYVTKLERTSYSLFELFSDMGGISSALFLIINTFVQAFAKNNINSMIAEKLFTTTRK